jgi:hypothetical protein
MNNHSRTIRTSLTVLSALSAIVALWQFYHFVQFRNTAGQLDPQGGTTTLLLAIGAALVACAAGAYVAFSLVNHDKDDVIHITS